MLWIDDNLSTRRDIGFSLVYLFGAGLVSKKVSQIFPDRPSSTDPTSSERSYKRYSHPTPSARAPPEPAYKIPEAPAPPSFFEETSYNPTAERVENQSNVLAHRPSRTRSLLQRLGSIRENAFSKNSRYGVLEDEEEGGVQRERGPRKLQEVEEDDDEEGIGVDISGLGGPIAMKSMRKKTKRIRNRQRDDDVEDEEDAATAGLEAEFNRLESLDRTAENLGSGMKSVIDAPFVARMPTQVKHKRAVSNVDPEARSAAIRAAEKTGVIQAITEAPTVDISDFGGAHYDSENAFQNTVDETGQLKKSYYFPPDPHMPDWKPFSMRWPYLSILILIGLGLAGLQEGLCQLSLKRAEEGKGLLEFKNAQQISNLAFFAWKYLPTMILVMYGIMWQISDYEVKRLEPYYQLSQKTGSAAGASLNMDYLTFLAYFVPFKAIRYRQWAVVFSSTGTLLASTLVPVLQSASVNMYPDQDHRKEDKFKFVRMDPGWSRALTASLAIVSCCGIAMLFQLRRRSGLLSDPKGIAGIAAMATRSHILNDFQGLDTALNPIIHKQLRDRRYILHKSSLWQGEYIKNLSSRDSVDEKTSENPHPVMLRLVAGIPYIFSLLLFATLIPIFMFTPANRATQAAPWLLTLLATLIKIVWNTMECDVRLAEPFYLLSLGKAAPRTLTMDYTGTIPGYMPIKAFLNGNHLLALVGVGAVMTEVLTVCVSSFSVDGSKFFPGQGESEDGNAADNRPNSGETFKSFWVSFSLSMGILLAMSVIAALVYVHRRHKFLPRQPGTIASVLAMIHQSNMLIDFVGTEQLDSRRMTQHLEKLGGSYGFGWFVGRDGEDHCGIDREPGRVRASHIGSWEVY
ncbi:hypothetical protein K402DRAFT_446032 [Aulographum hederae CBS 113979]|uniref:Uncharacterized protein n=1 Tax=Aulographum hederae CBS 113979 TaxID=1176131 RepID=A0A6G1H278_9PEZI|nr:hypothetical protein K402DRAFT_446032 [Aulographum hederae CBS 113979]